VRVDAAGRTAIPGIFAAGDASAECEPRRSAYVRTEHWEAAARQGASAARAMLGLQTPAAAPPSFWSDQHGVRIQFVGDTHGADRLEIDGQPAASDFTALFTHNQRPVAALIVGRPHALPELRKRIHDAASIQPPREERSMTLMPHIDELACAAHGDCALAAPEVFTIEDIAIVTGNGSDEAILEAAQACPAGAIIVTDEQTREQIYP
jgi:ferredoxin